VYFSRFLKGIPESPSLNDSAAIAMLEQDGIQCNWWLRVGQITPGQITERLTADNLYWHLNRYEQTQPGSSVPFSKDTPYISTTAGTVHRDDSKKANIHFPAFLTALSFATDFSRYKSGYIFYGYLLTLGRQATPLMEYAEEVRELHIYAPFLPFHDEGELVAKILIPAPRLQRVERWTYDHYVDQLEAGLDVPSPLWFHDNNEFARPEDYTNIRDVL
jgi:hypothetical protein